MNEKKIVLVAVVAADGGIGKDGDLLWHLPGDLKHFKALTMGAPVIMGRKTWESLPKRPLPGRQNIVITRNALYEASGAECAGSLAEAVIKADGERVFVIGGGSIYDEAIDMADMLEITEVADSCEDADTFFPDIDQEVWVLTEDSYGRDMKEEQGVMYRFLTYERR
ncbi:MAG: dihydrofolate reductase [Muribaculaceae bacterium]|nr:dihydrofolate reductase [Muribaculaceae bacterium]